MHTLLFFVLCLVTKINAAPTNLTLLNNITLKFTKDVVRLLTRANRNTNKIIDNLYNITKLEFPEPTGLGYIYFLLTICIFLMLLTIVSTVLTRFRNKKFTYSKPDTFIEQN